MDSIWMIETIRHSHDAYNRPSAEYVIDEEDFGYFLTKEEAQAACDNSNASTKAAYDRYVNQVLANNLEADAEKATWDLQRAALKKAGLPGYPFRPNHFRKTPRSYEDWVSNQDYWVYAPIEIKPNITN